MKLEDLPLFTVEEIHPHEDAGNTLIIGHLSHLRGVRSQRGYLYRSSGPSIVGELESIPTTRTEAVRFLTIEAEYAPDLKPGAVYPWLDGLWRPYHLKMVLSPTERWQRREFSASPARYFLLDGVTGWQSAEAELPHGATDLGVRRGDWNREHCELCPAELEASSSPEGFVDPDGRWICAHCYRKYALRNDISFAVGNDATAPKPST
jgi:hypothetical protein